MKLTNEEQLYETSVIQEQDNIISKLKKFINQTKKETSGSTKEDKYLEFIRSEPLFTDKFEEESKYGGFNAITFLFDKLKRAKCDSMHSKDILGMGYVEESLTGSMDSGADGFLELHFNNNTSKPSKTFSDAKGNTTSYKHFDEENNCAYISFEQPITELDTSSATPMYTKTGAKIYLSSGDDQKISIAGANIRIEPNGKINFSNAANKDLLTHPSIVAEIIKMYPESFKTIPSILYASDPHLFASAYKDGIIKNQPKNADVTYYQDADYTLYQMTEAAKSNARQETLQHKAIITTEKSINFDKELGE